eukprot:PhM_4_TR7892/c0_g1_i1/m.63383/K14834/NOC3; nucleolar complex protein 3
MNVSYIEKQLQKIDDIHLRPITDYASMKSALIDELEIYRDLVPGYKIKARGGVNQKTKDGATAMRKKDALIIEGFEQTLLVQYEKYLVLLIRFCEKKHPESQALGSRCLADLCGFAAHFNFNNALLKCVVETANSKLANVARPCLDALKELFASNEADEPALFVADAIVELVKERHHALNPKILYTFLHMRVRVVDMHRDKQNHKKMKRMKKEEERLAAQYRKAEGERSRGELAAVQTRLLQKVMTIYLRVLEASKHCSELHQSLLLAPTLEGLSKFAHLMNLELHTLLMSALKDIIEDAHTSITVSLHALVTVAALEEHMVPADGMARADLQEFHNALYRLIGDALELPKPAKTTAPVTDGENDDSEIDETASTIASTTGGSTAFSIAKSMAERRYVQNSPPQEWVYRAKLLLMACELLLVKMKRLPPVRIAAFVRKLSMYTTCVPPHIALGVYRMIQSLLSLNPAVTGIVVGGADNMIGTGEFNLEASSPDHANAMSSFVWELRSLRRSTHPTLRSMITHMTKEYCKAKKRPELLAQVPGTLDEHDPVQVLLKFDASKGGFNPQPQAPKRSRAQKDLDKRQVKKVKV